MFETKGNEAEWKLVYKRLSELEIGETVTYAELDRILGRYFRTFRAPIYRAKKELQGKNLRTIEAVKGVGYRVVHPNEHERLAVGHHRRARRQLTKAKQTVQSADRSLLDADTARRFDQLETTLAGHGQMIKRLEWRQDRIERSFKKVAEQQTEQSEEFESRLRQIEQVLARKQERAS